MDDVLGLLTQSEIVEPPPPLPPVVQATPEPQPIIQTTTKKIFQKKRTNQGARSTVISQAASDSAPLMQTVEDLNVTPITNQLPVGQVETVASPGNVLESTKTTTNFVHSMSIEKATSFVPWKPKHGSVGNGLIFVSIAAYRDAELLPTITSLLENARFPERLRFGICLQDTAAALNAFPYYGDTRFRILRVPADQSKGCCWARHHVQRLYQGEQFSTQLDSHHRFTQDWDARCIWMLHHCRSSKPILSTYLPPYTPATEHQDVQVQDLYSIAITGYDKQGLVVFHPQRFAPDEYPLNEPRPAFMIAGGFVFTLGEWISEVPYDPGLYFNGEEISLTVRSYTHGWDIFCPNLVVAFHYYQRKDEPRHWTDHADWRESNKHSVLSVLEQLKTGSGLGTERTLAQYQLMAGLDFTKRTSNGNAKRGLVSRNPPDAEPIEAGELWAPVVALSIDNEGWRPKPFQPVPAFAGSTLRSLVPGKSAPKAPAKAMGKSTPMKTVAKPITTNPNQASLMKNLFPAPPVQQYRRIDYPGGYLAKDSTGLWHEQKGGKRFATFQQRRGKPGDDYIMLYDGARQLHLRLDAKGTCHFLQGPLEEGDWRVNFNGVWQ
jgi:hypothetical protein